MTFPTIHISWSDGSSNMIGHNPTLAALKYHVANKHVPVQIHVVVPRTGKTWKWLRVK